MYRNRSNTYPNNPKIPEIKLPTNPTMLEIPLAVDEAAAALGAAAAAAPPVAVAPVAAAPPAAAAPSSSSSSSFS